MFLKNQSHVSVSITSRASLITKDILQALTAYPILSHFIKFEKPYKLSRYQTLQSKPIEVKCDLYLGLIPRSRKCWKFEFEQYLLLSFLKINMGITIPNFSATEVIDSFFNVPKLTEPYLYSHHFLEVWSEIV